MELRTPYFTNHVEMNCELTPEGGWRLPLAYGNPEDEILNVIKAGGFIDLSSMGTIFVMGDDSLEVMQRYMVNDVSKLKIGKGLYTSMVDEEGVLYDDITIFRTDDVKYLLVTTTPRAVPNYLLFKEEAKSRNMSVVEMAYGILCLNGPRTRDMLSELTDAVKPMKFFEIVETSLVSDEADIPCYIARAGITGEIGFEIYSHAKYSHILWNTLLKYGKSYSIKPFGLKAVASLSIEKGYIGPLDMYKGCTPVQLGLDWTIKFNKGDFIGRDALLKEKHAPKRKLVGLEAIGTDDIITPGSGIYKEEKVVGKITSANYGYRIKKSIASGYVENYAADLGRMLTVHDAQNNKKVTVKVVSRKHYDPDDSILKG